MREGGPAPAWPQAEGRQAGAGLRSHRRLSNGGGAVKKNLKVRPYRSLSIKARFGLHRQISATGPSAHALFGACGRLRCPTLHGRSPAGAEYRG